MIQPIYIYGNAVLRQTASEVDIDDKEGILSLVADLKDTLAKADGCGLAAPQIGVSKRVLIVDAAGMEETYPYLEGFKRTMINPVVLAQDTHTCTFNEGCLSIPGIYGDVTRPSSITVKYYDENFREQTETLDKFGCRMVQHELDHLDGHVFTDRLSPIRKNMLSKKLKNVERGKVSVNYKYK